MGRSIVSLPHLAGTIYLGVFISLDVSVAFVTRRRIAIRTWFHVQRNSFDDNAPQPTYGLYEVQEDMITKRGRFEAELMQGKSSIIAANKPKGTGSAGGFGGKQANDGKSSLSAQGKSHAKVIRDVGVVRIDNVLSEQVADRMKTYVTELRATAREEVESQSVPLRQRFADVLLRKNRSDLTMPLSEDVLIALHEVLCKSPVGSTIEALLGKNAVLYELSCLISDEGSDRQVVHPDTPCASDGTDEPVLFTCFIALQDITIDMGPTLWMPGTHKLAIHERFMDESIPAGGTESPKDALLRTQSYVWGALPKGACGIYDSRLLHCGTDNRNENSRALLYFSFKNPNIGYPGNPASIRPELAGRLDLPILRKELESFHKGKGCETLQSLASIMR